MSSPSQPIDDIRCADCGSSNVEVCLSHVQKVWWAKNDVGVWEENCDDLDSCNVDGVTCLDCQSENWKREEEPQGA
jgi:hypothetical protein